MNFRKNNTNEDIYAVLGLGRFGFALAKSLAEAGKEIIAVDRQESVINEAIAFTDNAFLVNDLSKENLRKLGIQNCSTVIVGIGAQIDVSILTTLTVLQLGVPHVIAKAISEDQGCVLEKLGAEVVYPERDMGIRLANRLIAPRVLEYIALSDDVSITEICLPEGIPDLTVQGLNLRQKYRLNIIAIKHGEDVTTDIMPNTTLQENDVIAVVGKHTQVTAFENDLQKKHLFRGIK